MTPSPRHLENNERLKLPPISSMDGYIQNRNIMAPPPLSPTPPWSLSNSNTRIDEQSIQPQQQHRTSLPSLVSSLSSSPSSSSSITAPINQQNQYHLRQHSLPHITATIPNTSSSSSLSTSAPSSSSLSIPKSSTRRPSIISQQEEEETRRRSSSSSSQDQAIIRIDNDVQEVIRQCYYLSDNMTQQKHLLLDQDYFCDSTKMQPWLDGMIGRANEVLNALLRLRKHQMAAEIARLHGNDGDATLSGNDDDNDSLQGRNQENESSNKKTNKSSKRVDANFHSIPQKKRGRRSVFQGRCHSCNISETPEWRRGPDGARTLCNACGLHYAKLARKKAEQQKDQVKNGKRTAYDVLVTDLSMQDYDSIRRPRRTHPQYSKPSSPLFDDDSEPRPSENIIPSPPTP
ncbi:uncharacterized protein BX664DRAFT_320225 [Halteromyces radiatus]|uniref:uncharacterized protein n=1 Tax=Halteromyces radiatus TaxID=101107 RepID=UPI0022206AFD|nr:uncharacterized protein BX664DRAFT_320225 [Halteromyces radiatus]KAI8099034.1 hypothetical protein BX664DRAFT_320225 [Halteromyces radiatus]